MSPQIYALALLGNDVNTVGFCPLGLLKQLLVTYMLYSNALLILYYVFTLQSCDGAIGVRYLISVQAWQPTIIWMDYTCYTLVSKLFLLKNKVQFL